MSLADPLEVPEAEVAVSILKSMQCQLTAAQKLLSLLRARRDETKYAAVEEQLLRVDTHLREAVRSMIAPVGQQTTEVSPTIPWMAASPTEDRQTHGALLTLRERGDILSRAMQARKMNNNTVISAEHDPVISQPH